VIYPALEVLQDLGEVEARLEDGKKTMHITPAGQTRLDKEEDALAAIHARLGALAEGDVEADPRDVRKAMHRLRHVVVRTVRSREASETIRAEVAAKLNALSDELERRSED